MQEYVLGYPLQSQQPLFAAQHNFSLDRFIPSQQTQACYSSETVAVFLASPWDVVVSQVCLFE